MIVVPIAGVLVSLAKGRRQGDERQESESVLEVGGRAGGAVALVIAAVSGVVVIILFRLAVLGVDEKVLVWLSLPPAVVALVVGNYLLERHNSRTARASWLARWAGILATVDIGAFIALNLIYFTRQQKVGESVLHPQEQLSRISYLILGIVFLLIIGGLGWCFYKALLAAGRTAEPQYADGVGDQEQQTEQS
jgi:hypothetical protein